MAGVGARYAEEYDDVVHDRQQVDAQLKETLKMLVKSKLESLMFNPDYYAFGNRKAILCSLTCALTQDQEEQLRGAGWTAGWGVGASGNRQ